MRAPLTGFPSSRSRPVTGVVSFDDGVQPRTVSWLVERLIRAAPVAATRVLIARRAAADGTVDASLTAVWFVVARSACSCEPLGSEKTINCAAVPPFDEVGVPPTVIATYSVPPTEKIVAPAAIGLPVLKVQRTFPVFVANARMTPSPPPAKPSPDAVVVMPPRSGSGVWNFQTRWP